MRESFHVNPLHRGKIDLCPFLDVNSHFKQTPSLFFLTHTQCIFISLSIYSPLPPGPGPVDTPVVSRLQSRSVTTTWVPPSQPNGIITKYTLYLCPSSTSTSDSNSSSSMTLSSSSGRNKSLLASTERAYLNSSHNLRPTSSLLSAGFSHVSTSTDATGRYGSSSTVQGYSPGLLPNTPSSLSHGITDDNQIESISPSDSPISGFFSEVSDLHTSIVSVAVPGNTSSYTFFNLPPYQNYSLQVRYMRFTQYWYARFNIILCKEK